MKQIFGAICIGLSVMLTFAGCGSGNASQVKKTTGENGFYMEYSAFDGVEYYDIELSQGDELKAEFSHERGSIDLSVAQDGKTPIYTGNEQTEASFVLIADDEGSYRITVTGHNADGQVSFMLVKK